MDGKRLPPLTNRNRGDLQRGGYLLIVRPLSRSQDNAAAQSQRLRCRGGTDEFVEGATSRSGEFNSKRDTGHCYTVPEAPYNIKNYQYDVLVFGVEGLRRIPPAALPKRFVGQVSCSPLLERCQG